MELWDSFAKCEEHFKFAEGLYLWLIETEYDRAGSKGYHRDVAGVCRSVGKPVDAAIDVTGAVGYTTFRETFEIGIWGTCRWFFC